MSLRRVGRMALFLAWLALVCAASTAIAITRLPGSAFSRIALYDETITGSSVILCFGSVVIAIALWEFLIRPFGGDTPRPGSHTGRFTYGIFRIVYIGVLSFAVLFAWLIFGTIARKLAGDHLADYGPRDPLPRYIVIIYTKHALADGLSMFCAMMTVSLWGTWLPPLLGFLRRHVGIVRFLFGVVVTLLWSYCTWRNYGTADALINSGFALVGLAGLAMRSWAIPAALAGAFIGSLLGASIPHRSYTPVALATLFAFFSAWIAWDVERQVKVRR